MRWIFPNEGRVEQSRELAEALGIPMPIAELLARRGLKDPEEGRGYLEPRLSTLSDPFLLPDMGKAVERILEAIRSKERVVLYGDYDVDGVSSLALLWRVLKAYGANATCFLPVRDGEGYGLSEAGLARCRQQHDPRLLIAVDCGTSNVAEIQALKRDGIDVVVLDHHECPPQIPDCVALVNPKRAHTFHYLCSVGIVFKLAHALLKRERVEGLDLRDFLDLVALGTLADLVPLREENRILVKRGLLQLGKTKWPGIRALMEVAGVRAPLEASDVGFKLGPRMNAAGRLGTAQDALELLLAEEMERARELAQRLDLQNKDRRAVEEQVFGEAEEQIQKAFHPETRASLVLGSNGWHSGVVGIVASRLMRRYYRPVFVVGFDGDGMGKGSGRSIPGLGLVDALQSCQAHLLKFGGHEMAAGVSLRFDALDAFRDAFEQYAKSVLEPRLLEPAVEIDAELQLSQVTPEMLSEYEALAPFGMGNPQPLFALRRVHPSAPPRMLKEKHLQFALRQGRSEARAIWFNAPVKEALPTPPWDVAFELSRNEFQGNVTAQILVKALRSSE